MKTQENNETAKPALGAASGSGVHTEVLQAASNLDVAHEFARRGNVLAAIKHANWAVNALARHVPFPAGKEAMQTGACRHPNA